MFWKLITCICLIHSIPSGNNRLMLNSLITAKDRTVTKEPYWDCCTNAPHGVRFMCGQYNRNQGSDIAIYKSGVTILFNSLPWKSKLLSTLVFLISLHLCFAPKSWNCRIQCQVSLLQSVSCQGSSVLSALISWTLTHWNCLPSVQGQFSGAAQGFLTYSTETCLIPSSIPIQHVPHAA